MIRGVESLRGCVFHLLFSCGSHNSIWSLSSSDRWAWSTWNWIFKVGSLLSCSMSWVFALTLRCGQMNPWTNLFMKFKINMEQGFRNQFRSTAPVPSVTAWVNFGCALHMSPNMEANRPLQGSPKSARCSKNSSQITSKTCDEILSSGF